MSTNEPIITMAMARRLGYCAAGSERMLERYGINVVDFLKNGYPARKALAEIDNVLVKKLANAAIDEWEKQRGQG